MLRVTARDRSLWNFFRGNESVVQKNLTIDITPPSLEVVADDRYVNFGGVGVIVYKPSPDTITSGIKIGNYFFPGYKGQIKEHRIITWFFSRTLTMSRRRKRRRSSPPIKPAIGGR